MDFQEDNLGYMYKETYVQMDQGNRTQKVYQARVDPTFDAGNRALFIMSHEAGGKTFLISTNYTKDRKCIKGFITFHCLSFICTQLHILLQESNQNSLHAHLNVKYTKSLDINRERNHIFVLIYIFLTFFYLLTYENIKKFQ